MGDSRGERGETDAILKKSFERTVKDQDEKFNCLKN